MSIAGAEAPAVPDSFSQAETEIVEPPPIVDPPIVEPPIVELGMATLVERDKTWYAERQPILEERVRVRLGELSSRLGNADWLDDAFTAGDLLMVTVLRRLDGSGLVEKYPNLSAYVARGEARPAYKRAFEDQLAVFTGKPPPGR